MSGGRPGSAFNAHEGPAPTFELEYCTSSSPSRYMHEPNGGHNMNKSRSFVPPLLRKPPPTTLAGISALSAMSKTLSPPTGYVW